MPAQVRVCVCFDDSSCVGKRSCPLLKQAIDPQMLVVPAVIGVRGAALFVPFRLSPMMRSETEFRGLMV